MGPLQGSKIIEIAGIGPGPFCAMLLSDLAQKSFGSNRLSSRGMAAAMTCSMRGRKSLIDLKKLEGVQLF